MCCFYPVVWVRWEVIKTMGHQFTGLPFLRVRVERVMSEKRRYLQGTLDYHCGVYSVINALACLRGISLQAARTILSESIIALQSYPHLLKAFLRNETDHYWMVAYCLARWTRLLPFQIGYDQLYGDVWVPSPLDDPEAILGAAQLYLPEKTIAYDKLGQEKQLLDMVWLGLHDWLRPNTSFRMQRAALMRFHYYLRGERVPLVSHWTTVIKASKVKLDLHDASANDQAIHTLNYGDMLANARVGANAIRIVPESVVLLCL